MTYNEGVFSFLRGHQHVNDGYKEENWELAEEAALLNWSLEQLWDMDEEENHEAYKQALQTVLNELKLCRDGLKQDTFERIARGISPYDSLGRFNPMSRCPIIWSSRDLLEERGKDIDKIRQSISQRKLLAINKLDEILRLEEDVYRHLRMLKQEMNRGRMTERRAKEAKQIFRQDWKKLKKERVYLRPFGPVFADVIRDLQSGCEELTQASLPQSFRSAKKRIELLQKFRELEQIYQELSLKKTCNNTTEKQLKLMLETLDKFESKQTGLAQSYLETALQKKELEETDLDDIKDIVNKAMQSLV
jgi:hypothetical protein